MHFLNDYTSLIQYEPYTLHKTAYQWNYTQSFTTDSIYLSQNITFYTLTGQDKGFNLMIVDSTFKESRFCRGLIYYVKPTTINQTLSILNLTHLYMNSSQSNQRTKIELINSVFENLNIFTNVTMLTSKNKSYYALDDGQQLEAIIIEQLKHKGIVMNLQGYEGDVIIDGCLVNQNMHYIPEIKYDPMRNEEETQQLFDFYNKEQGMYHMSYCDDYGSTKYVFRHLLKNQTNED